jgi:hypothetical protein
LRQSAYLYFLHAENFASVFKLHSIHDSAYFLEELSDCEELVGGKSQEMMGLVLVLRHVRI